MLSDDIAEDENTIRFGKGKHTILVGKKQYEAIMAEVDPATGLLKFQGADVLLELARRQGIGWITGGPLCKSLVETDIRYLLDLGVSADDIKEHYKKNYPLAFKACVLREPLNAEEEAQAHKKALAHIAPRPPMPSRPAPPKPEPEPEPEPETEPKEPEQEIPVLEQDSDAKSCLSEDETPDDETIQNYITTIEDAEGHCCGSNPQYVAVTNAVSSICGEAIADQITVDFIECKGDPKRLWELAVQEVGDEAKLIKTAFDLLPNSMMGRLLQRCDNPEITRLYLTGEPPKDVVKKAIEKKGMGVIET